MNCPICQSGDTTVFDSRELVPVHQNGFCATPEEARAIATGTLEMTGCRNCGFAWNAAFDPERIVYDERYENDQSHSEAFQRHLAGRADRVLEASRTLRGEDLNLVEVGAGQGYFLSLLGERSGRTGDSYTGFDPAWRGPDGPGPDGARMFRTLYTPATAAHAGGAPDAVVTRHTIEHIAGPLAFLSGIRTTSGCPVIFVETPRIDWIIRNGQVQDLFYEHCSLFSRRSLATALQRAGYGKVEVRPVFDGQYLWAEAGLADEGEDVPDPAPDFDAWQSRKQAFLSEWDGLLDRLSARGPVYLWGGGSKGVTFSLLMDREGRRISGVIDINPKKQGGFLPVTAIPVLPPEALPEGGATVIVTNPVYRTEIETLLRTLGRKARLLSLASEEA